MVKKIESKQEFTEVLAKGTVAVDFTATWCGPCKMIGPKFEEFSKEYTSIIFVKVDVDECDDIAAENGVSAMPTFMIFKDGQKVDDLVGASEAKLKELLEKYK